MLFNRTLVRVVCKNHHVTKSRTGTSTDPGSINYCYVAILYAPTRLLSLTNDVGMRGETHSCPSSHTIYERPIYPHTVSYAQPCIPRLRLIITKIPRLPHRFLHGVLRSPEHRPSPSFFRVPCHPSLLDVETSSYLPPLSLPLPDSCRCFLATAIFFL